jgi:DNA-binding NtrC family response regulator
MCNMAWNAVRLRKFDDANEIYERGEAQARLANNLHLNLLVTFGRAELELLAGHTEAACAEFKSAERLATIVSHGALRTRILVWKSIINRKIADGDMASQFSAAASDLRAQCLETECAIVLLMTATWARVTSELPYEHLLAKAYAIFRNNPEAKLLEAHYTRIMETLSQSRRRPKQSFPKFLTQAPAILTLKDRLKRLIDTDVRIMLEGESGTGKTFLARQLHAASRRRKSPFVVVDCTNLEENLFESKLFGHLRGAFTGAVSNRVGLIEEANRGTLFLDEFGELSPAIQAKLLYTIEEQRYRPVGSRVEKTAEFRVLAATNRDIDQMLETGQLREDLFFRLSGCRVKLPPLRERREDIAPLAEHQIVTLNERYRRKKTLKAEAWNAIARYRWPGNVRELNATLERGFHLAAGRRIGVDDLGLGLSTTSLDAEDLSWYSVRRAHLLKVLRMCRGNVSRSAQLLGVNRTTLIYKLKLLDIERPDFDPAFRGQDRRKGTASRLVVEQEEPETTTDSMKEFLEP